MPEAPRVEFDPAFNRATVKRLPDAQHDVYLWLEGGDAESFYLFTEEQIGDPDILDDEKVANYFGQFLAEKGWSAVRSDVKGPDNQIATWLLAPGSG